LNNIIFSTKISAYSNMTNFQLSAFLEISGIGAASGIIFRENQLYIISDNSTFLYQYNLERKELQKINLFFESQENIPKKEKFDFEALTLRDEKLYIFGSGSTENRNLRISYDLQTQEISQKDLSKTYKNLVQKTQIDKNDLNIEGAFFHNQKWHLFQRGNSSNSQNGIFITDKTNDTIDFIAFSLPKVQNIQATFTDAILVEDKIYFLSAVEDTDSTYDDGEVLGSFIGRIDLATMALESTIQISETNKFEGLTLYSNSESEIIFLLCEDNDTEDLETTIYKLILKL
jgi:hypothetical protein